jgi:hypothetical protein
LVSLRARSSVATRGRASRGKKATTRGLASFAGLFCCWRVTRQAAQGRFTPGSAPRGGHTQTHADARPNAT